MERTTASTAADRLATLYGCPYIARKTWRKDFGTLYAAHHTAAYMRRVDAFLSHKCSALHVAELEERERMWLENQVDLTPMQYPEPV